MFNISPLTHRETELCFVAKDQSKFHISGFLLLSYAMNGIYCDIIVCLNQCNCREWNFDPSVGSVSRNYQYQILQLIKGWLKEKHIVQYKKGPSDWKSQHMTNYATIKKELSQLWEQKEASANNKQACSSFRQSKIIDFGTNVCLSTVFFNKFCVGCGTNCTATEKKCL